MKTIDQGTFSDLNQHFNMMTDTALEEEFMVEELKKTQKAPEKYSPSHAQYKFSPRVTRPNPTGFTPHPDSDIPHDINDSKARRENRQSKKIQGKLAPKLHGQGNQTQPTASARRLSPVSSRSEAIILGTKSVCTVSHNLSLQVAKSFPLGPEDKEPVVIIP